jgi:hypothetical protein
VPGAAPPGTYTLTLHVGDYPADVTATAGFTFEKVIGIAPRGEGVPWAGAPLTAEGEFFGVSPSEGTTFEASADVALATLPVSPNPFAGRAAVTYALDATAVVRIALYDVLGREVAVLTDGRYEAGQHEATLDAERLPAGVDLVRATAGPFVQTERVTVLR